MGLKKNSPGCNCCESGFCLQEDARKWQGISISGVPVFTVSLTGATSTSYDANADYLWAAALSQGSGSVCRIPTTNWRLGNAMPNSGCCRVRWIQSQRDTIDTGIRIPTSSCGDVQINLVIDRLLNLSCTILATSVQMELTLAENFFYDHPTNFCVSTPGGTYPSTTRKVTTGGTDYFFGPITGSSNINGFWLTTHFDLTKSNVSGLIDNPFSITQTPTTTLPDFFVNATNYTPTCSLSGSSTALIDLIPE